MRKYVKSPLYDEFVIVDEHELSRIKIFFVHGDSPQHRCNTDQERFCNTYHYVCMQCVKSLKNIFMLAKHTRNSVIR